MSSIAEGSEGWEREDELDLGQPDGLPAQHDDDLALDHAEDLPQESLEGDLDVVENEEDRASENTVEAAGPDLPQTPPARRRDQDATPESVGETSSTPDDSPSLHVSSASGAQSESF